MLARKLIAPTAGGGGGWSPTDLSGLLGWWDASDYSSITESSGVTSQWNDLSGNGCHFYEATSGDQPTYESAGFNSSYPCISFDGNTDKMQTSAFVSTSGDKLTAAVVCQVTNSGGDPNGRLLAFSRSTLADWNNTDRAVIIYRKSATLLGTTRNSGDTGTKGYSNNTPMTVFSCFDGTNHTLYVDNSAGTPVASTGNFSASNDLLAIAAQPYSNLAVSDINLPCKIAEIIIFTDTFDSALQSTVQSYFETKWGL